MSLKKQLSILLCTSLMGSTLLVAQSAKPKDIKPGWNLFSKDQDVQMGKEYAQQIEHQLDVLPPGPLNDYVSQLGNMIAAQPQANGFPYVFKMVNDPNINAFALPGGPIYIHSAVLVNAESEGQLMGVIAHECSHVALRHSTNQVTKANALQIPAMIAGVYGQSKGGLIGTLTQLGVGLGAQSLILKFSRGAENQADLLGARMMSQVGYNPLEMARFFEILEAKYGKGGSQFFADHPNPGNRVKSVSDEILLLPQRNYTADTGKFERMKMLAKALPTPRKKAAPNAVGEVPNQPPQNSDGSRTWSGDRFRVNYPGDWLGLGEPNSPAVTLAPREGLKQTSNGGVDVGFGVIVAHYVDDDGKFEFRADTEKLIAQIQQQNSTNRNQQPQINQNTINGRRIYVTKLTSKSPLDGGTEIDTVVTMEHRGGMLYLVFVAPEREMANAQRVFDGIINSLTLQ